ncbi:MAG: CHAT domain-containing protein [Pyrinomonadaceae bacterium]
MKKHNLSPRINIKHALGMILTIWLGLQLVLAQEPNPGTQALLPGQRLERVMTGAVSHRFEFNLERDEFFQARVEQKGVDLVLKLRDADGSVLATMDSPNSKDGPETLSYVAAKAGRYVLEVASFDEKAVQGSFTIRREAARTATAVDRRRVEVERSFVEAMAAQKGLSQAATALAKLEVALTGWRELKEEYLSQLTAQMIQQLKEAQATMNVRQLAVGRNVEQRLGAGERHFYLVELKQGQVVRIEVQGKELDVRLTFGRADERQPLALANFGLGDKNDRESLTAVAETAGSYALQVDASAPTAAGVYQLSAQVRDEATEEDRKRITAERLMVESLKHRNKGDLAAAVADLEEALTHWRELRDEHLTLSTIIQAQQVKLLLNPLDMVRRLPTGETLERQLSGGEVHQYVFRLERGQVLRADAEEKGINLIIALSKFPDEEPLTQANVGVGNDRETLTFIAEEAGMYALLAGSPDLFLSGKYRLTAQIRKGATVADTERIRAARLLAEGKALWHQESPGSIHAALAKAEESLLLWQKLDDQYWESRTRTFLGIVHHYAGESHRALEYYRQALALQQAVTDQRGQASTLGNIGGVYGDLADEKNALVYFEQALTVFKSIGDKSGEAIVLSNIGATYKAWGKRESALAYFNQALALHQADKFTEGEAIALNNIGSLYMDMGDTQRALEYFDRALQLKRDARFRRGEATTLNNIGQAYYQRGDFAKALDYYQQTLPLVMATGQRRGEASTLNNIMYVWKVMGNRRAAIFYAKQSVNKFQELRGAARGIDNETQKSFLQSFQNTYQTLTEMLLEEGQPEQAVQILNLYQDQQFFDFNAAMNSPPRRVALSPRESELAALYEASSERVGSLGAQVEELSRQAGLRLPGGEEAVQLQKLDAELKAASDAFLTVLKDAGVKFAGGTNRDDKASDTPDVAEMQTTLARLGTTTNQKTAALYTLIGESRFHTILITPELIREFSSPVGATEMNKKILQFYSLSKSPDYDPRPLGKELYDIIFKPIEAELKKTGAQTLMWSLDGTLRYIPVAALWDGEKYLVERYQNVVFTRADGTRMTQAVSPKWTGYGFSASEPHRVEFLGRLIEFKTLDFGKDEMLLFRTHTQPGGLIDGDVFSEAAFNKESLVESLRRNRPLVHISSHFRFYPGDSAQSFMLLGDGRIMTLGEMKEHPNLFEGVELLTLSACDTAAQLPDANGREVDGFAELAQRLGAKSVMASLWQVRDRSTSQLMKRFYQNRQVGKLNKAEALRMSQIDMLYGRNEMSRQSEADRSVKSDAGVSLIEDIVVEARYRITFKKDEKRPFAHPYYWSPFVLFGNWK